MYELKTRPAMTNPLDIIAAVPHARKRADAEKLLELFAHATGQEPVVWGEKVIGYGSWRYQYPSEHRGEIYAMGFYITKRNITLHLDLDGAGQQRCLKRLGKHSRGKSCLYINKLNDVDLEILEELLQNAWRLTEEMQGAKKDEKSESEGAAGI